MQRPKSNALNSFSLWVVALSKSSWSNLLNALLMLDLISFGASFAILRAFYRIASGTISMEGSGGGSDVT